MLDTTAGLYPEVLEFLGQEEVETRNARVERAYRLLSVGRITRYLDNTGFRFDVRDTDGRHVGFAVPDEWPGTGPVRVDSIRKAVFTRLIEMLETGEIR